MTDTEWKAWCDQPGTDAFGFPWSSWKRLMFCPDHGCTCVFCARKAKPTPVDEITAIPVGPMGQRARAADVNQMDLFA